MTHDSLIGKQAPNFKTKCVFNQEIFDLSLDQYLKKKYIILLFYPLNFTFICPTELLAFNERYSEFQSLSTEILAISVDSHYSHLAWSQLSIKEGGIGTLNYPLVSDLQKTISTDYNILNEDGIALRALFIIDNEGIIQHSTINNLQFGRSVDECIRTLQAIQYVKTHADELCPVNWQPGMEGLLSL